MLYNEEAVRANIRNREGKRIFYLGKGDQLTSAARDYLSRERIEIRPGEQAKQDWRAGRFPLVPGDSEEYIPVPDKPRWLASATGGLVPQEDVRAFRLAQELAMHLGTSELDLDARAAAALLEPAPAPGRGVPEPAPPAGEHAAAAARIRAGLGDHRRPAGHADRPTPGTRPALLRARFR